MSKEASIFARIRESKLNEGLQDGNNKGFVNENNTNEDDHQVEDNGNQEVMNEEVTLSVCPCCSEIYEDQSFCPECGEELLEKIVLKVRDGKVIRKNVSSRKRRLTPAQKKALAQARKKAHTGSANKKRKKSMKKAMKLKEEVEDDDVYSCPKCDFEGSLDDYDSLGDGEYECPECGAVLVIPDDEDESCKNKGKSKSKSKSKKTNEGVETLLNTLGAPEDIMEAFGNGEMETVSDYLKENYSITI